MDFPTLSGSNKDQDNKRLVDYFFNRIKEANLDELGNPLYRAFHAMNEAQEHGEYAWDLAFLTAYPEALDRFNTAHPKAFDTATGLYVRRGI
jgi:hypothetical protein